MESKREVFVVQGTGGKRVLAGTIPVYGAKNAVLKAFAASVLFDDGMTLTGVPDIEDVHRITELLDHCGADVTFEKDRTYNVHANKKFDTNLDTNLAKRFRASVVLTGPILARYKKVSFPHPGGCVLGGRPIDVFLSAYEALGAKIVHKKDRYYLSAPKGLVGATINFRVQSVTGTETIMMAATLARGVTVLKNAAMEPEIVELAKYLNQSGALIEGAGTPTMTITGVKSLRTEGIPYVTMPDRIEAGSFIILAALLGKDVTVANCEPAHMESLLQHLMMMGVDLTIGKDFVRVRGNSKTKLKSIDVKTHEYPGFPTDIQAPMMIALTQAEGESTVFETIFEDRLRYVESLKIMGADVTIMNPLQVIVRGPKPMRGKELESPDLRAGLAYLIAAGVAEGQSIIGTVYNIDRGYEKIEERLSAIGFSIRREIIG